MSSRISTRRGRVEWFAALDYGFAHYTVCLLGCRDGDGNMFVVDEHAERLWLPQRHAAAIKAMLGRHQIGDRKLELGDLQRFVAGADVFSPAERWDDDRAAVCAARNHAAAGQHGPGEWLGGGSCKGWVMRRMGIRPTLFIHTRCGRLIETLPALQHDPNRPEDVLKVDADEDGVGGDDAADCLRYLVATKSRTIAQRKLRGL